VGVPGSAAGRLAYRAVLALRELITTQVCLTISGGDIYPTVSIDEEVVVRQHGSMWACSAPGRNWIGTGETREAAIMMWMIELLGQTEEIKIEVSKINGD